MQDRSSFLCFCLSMSVTTWIDVSHKHIHSFIELYIFSCTDSNTPENRQNIIWCVLEEYSWVYIILYYFLTLASVDINCSWQVVRNLSVWVNRVVIPSDGLSNSFYGWFMLKHGLTLWFIDFSYISVISLSNYTTLLKFTFTLKLLSLKVQCC